MANFKKSGGRIFGVQFSKKEQDAIDREIQRQCAEYDRKNEAWLFTHKLKEYGLDIEQWNKEDMENETDSD